MSTENKKYIISLSKLFIKENKDKIKLIITSDFDMDFSEEEDVFYKSLSSGFNPLIKPVKVTHKKG